MDEKLKQVTDICNKYDQEQLLDAYKRIKDEKERQEFLDKILTIDFKKINQLYKETKKEQDFNEENVKPISYIDKSKLTKEQYDKYYKIGERTIKE